MVPLKTESTKCFDSKAKGKYKRNDNGQEAMWQEGPDIIIEVVVKYITYKLDHIKAVEGQ